MYIKSVLSWTAFGLKVTVRIKTDVQIVLLDNKGRYFNHGLELLIYSLCIAGEFFMHIEKRMLIFKMIAQKIVTWTFVLEFKSRYQEFLRESATYGRENASALRLVEYRRAA
jgi:hypothetical protein